MSSRNIRLIESTDKPALEERKDLLAPFLQRLKHIAPRAWVEHDLPEPVRCVDFDAHRPIWSEHDSSECLFVLEEGFAYGFTILPDGRRHISDIFGPGAICNWTRLRSPEARMDICFKRGSRAALLRIEDLLEAIHENSRLEGVISRHELARTLRTSQRTRALIAMPGPERLMNVMLDVQSELFLGREPEQEIEMPLTQTEVGDMIGQTNVHVNRILKTLADSDRLRRDGQVWTIVDPAAEMDRLDYRDFFARGCRA